MDNNFLEYDTYINSSNELDIQSKYNSLIDTYKYVNNIVNQTILLKKYISFIRTRIYIPTLSTINENTCSQTQNINDNHNSNSTKYKTNNLSRYYDEYYNEFMKYLTIYKKNNYIFIENISNVVKPLISVSLTKTNLEINKFFNHSIQLCNCIDIKNDYKIQQMKKIINDFYCNSYSCNNKNEIYKWNHDLLNITIECKNYTDNNFDFIIYYKTLKKNKYTTCQYSLCKNIKQLRNNKFKFRRNKLTISKIVLYNIYNIIRLSPIISKLIITYKYDAKEVALYILSLLKCSDDIYYKFVLLTGDNKCNFLVQLLNTINVKFNYETLDCVLNDNNFYNNF